jgi:hypothetical protein
MTIAAKITEIAKYVEPNPFVIATAVASAHTIAECELGIPPLLTMRLRSSPLPRHKE